MEIREYVKEAKKTRASLDTQSADALHMVLGIVTEAGELADNFKRNLAYNTPLDKTNLVEELGDLFWYIANLMDILDINPDAVLEANIAKLKRRYPNGFAEKDAVNRNASLEKETIENIITP